MKGIEHTDVGNQLTKTEYHAETAHDLDSGTSFPGSPSEKDLFYRADLHRWFIYFGSAWIDLTLAKQLGIEGAVELPLSAFYYRLGFYALVYREGSGDDEYAVLDVHADHWGWYSMYSISRRFARGHYIEWEGKMTAYGAHKTYWIGGLEWKHGRYDEGLATFEVIPDGTHKAVTSWNGSAKATVIPAQDWTSNKKFKIAYDLSGSDNRIRFYIDDVLKVTHTGVADHVPDNKAMSFFIEISHHEAGPPTSGSKVYYKWRSFKYGAL